MTPTLNFVPAANARRANKNDAPAAPPTNFRLDRCLIGSISSLPALSLSGMDCIPHARNHPAHIGKAAGHAGPWVVRMTLVLKVDEAFVLHGDERFKNSADRHLAVTHCYLAFPDFQVGPILHVHVEQARSELMYCLEHVRARALGVAYIDAAADSRVHVLDELQDVERRLPELVFGTMVVDCDPDVVLLDELLYPRKTGGRGISGDDDRDAGPLAILKFGADVVVFVLGEVDGARSVKFDICCCVIGDGLRFLRWIGWKMVFDILCVQRRDVELLHVADHLGAAEVAKGITGEAELDRGRFACAWHA